MLSLGRTVGQRIFIGDDIKITVLSIRGSKVRLGFDLPRSITVLREEVAKRQINVKPPDN